jgi:hypothetical protein
MMDVWVSTDVEYGQPVTREEAAMRYSLIDGCLAVRQMLKTDSR